MKRLYHILATPRHHIEDTRNREVVLNVLLTGTLSIALLSFLLLAAKIIFLGATYLNARAFVVLGVLLFAGWLYWLSRRGKLKAASCLLVGIYFLLATAMTYEWGVNVPIGILLHSLVIVLSGILLGPIYSLYAAAAVATVLIALVQASKYGLIQPDLSWASAFPGLIDVAGFSFVFGVIALVSWLFNQQMARSLHKAEEAESALMEQKSLLETIVEERTRDLQAEQLEKIQQMYRFAELGQLSTAMMHDLANHLTSLTLNIENLEGTTRSKMLGEAKRSIRHIDNMVDRVRDQLNGRTNVRTFNVASEIEEIVQMLRHKGHMADVQLNWQSPTNKKPFRCKGETIRFRQMVANLICNGFDAYDDAFKSNEHERRKVVVTAVDDKSDIIITVDDWGRGIPTKERPKLFKPFHSTKEMGMGMGLFIVRQIVEEHFLGSVTIDLSKKYTSFVVKLPKANT